MVIEFAINDAIWKLPEASLGGKEGLLTGRRLCRTPPLIFLLAVLSGHQVVCATWMLARPPTPAHKRV